MPTNGVNLVEYGERVGESVALAIGDTLQGFGSSFGEATQPILTGLTAIAVAFLVIVGFWIVLRNLVRSANMTGRRR